METELFSSTFAVFTLYHGYGEDILVSGLLFEDCIVLISSTTAGLKKLFKLVKKHCDHLLLGINNGEDKFKVISPGDELWEILDDQGTVDISLRPFVF